MAAVGAGMGVNVVLGGASSASGASDAGAGRTDRQIRTRPGAMPRLPGDVSDLEAGVGTAGGGAGEAEGAADTSLSVDPDPDGDLYGYA